jgi:uncharacterized protein
MHAIYHASLKKTMTNPVHIQPRHQKALLDIIHTHLPESRILIYGSRINGRSHEGSDLDIALQTSTLDPIPTDIMTTLLEDIRDSSIPFLVDIRDWTRLPTSFQEEINRHHVVW